MLPSSFLTTVSIWLSVSLIYLPFLLLIGFLFLGMFNKVKSIQGIFSLTGVTIDNDGKPFGETGKLWTSSSSDSIFTSEEFLFLLILFIIFLCIISLLIWSCKKSFVMPGYSSALVISSNILFVSALYLHKYRILLIAKNTSLCKAFTSKNEMLSDVISNSIF